MSYGFELGQEVDDAAADDLTDLASDVHVEAGNFT